MKATKRSYVLRDTETGKFYKEGGTSTPDLKRAYFFGTKKGAMRIRLSTDEVVIVTMELSIEEG